jgi:hypothetical protein
MCCIILSRPVILRCRICVGGGGAAIASACESRHHGPVWKTLVRFAGGNSVRRSCVLILDPILTELARLPIVVWQAALVARR